MHEHRFSILVGNAPITMMAGARLPLRRACSCGEMIRTGSYQYNPPECGTVTCLPGACVYVREGGIWVCRKCGTPK